MQEYENLTSLFVGYLNQDFPDVTGSVEDTIKDFINDSHSYELVDTLLEIKKIYLQYQSKEKVTSFLNDYFCDSAYDFLYDFPDGRAWLEYVECIIKDELKKRSEDDNDSK